MALNYWAAPPGTLQRAMAYQVFQTYHATLRDFFGGQVPFLFVPDWSVGAHWTANARMSYTAGWLDGDGWSGVVGDDLRNSLSPRLRWTSVMCPTVTALIRQLVTNGALATASNLLAAAQTNRLLAFPGAIGYVYEPHAQLTILAWIRALLPFTVTHYQSFLSLCMLNPNMIHSRTFFVPVATALMELGRWQHPRQAGAPFDSSGWAYWAFHGFLNAIRPPGAGQHRPLVPNMIAALRFPALLGRIVRNNAGQYVLQVANVMHNIIWPWSR